MEAGDTFATHHRWHGIFLTRGADPKQMMAKIAERKTGYCKVKGGSMHIADGTLGHLGAIVGREFRPLWAPVSGTSTCGITISP